MRRRLRYCSDPWKLHLCRGVGNNIRTGSYRRSWYICRVSIAVVQRICSGSRAVSGVEYGEFEEPYGNDSSELHSSHSLQVVTRDSEFQFGRYRAFGDGCSGFAEIRNDTTTTSGDDVLASTGEGSNNPNKTHYTIGMLVATYPSTGGMASHLGVLQHQDPDGFSAVSNAFSDSDSSYLSSINGTTRDITLALRNCDAQWWGGIDCNDQYWSQWLMRHLEYAQTTRKLDMMGTRSLEKYNACGNLERPLNTTAFNDHTDSSVLDAQAAGHCSLIVLPPSSSSDTLKETLKSRVDDSCNSCHVGFTARIMGYLEFAVQRSAILKKFKQRFKYDTVTNLEAGNSFRGGPMYFAVHGSNMSAALVKESEYDAIALADDDMSGGPAGRRHLMNYIDGIQKNVLCSTCELDYSMIKSVLTLGGMADLIPQLDPLTGGKLGSVDVASTGSWSDAFIAEGIEQGNSTSGSGSTVSSGDSTIHFGVDSAWVPDFLRLWRDRILSSDDIDENHVTGCDGRLAIVSYMVSAENEYVYDTIKFHPLAQKMTGVKKLWSVPGSFPADIAKVAQQLRSPRFGNNASKKHDIVVSTLDSDHTPMEVLPYVGVDAWISNSLSLSDSLYSSVVMNNPFVSTYGNKMGLYEPKRNTQFAFTVQNQICLKQEQAILQTKNKEDVGLLTMETDRFGSLVTHLHRDIAATPSDRNFPLFGQLKGSDGLAKNSEAVVVSTLVPKVQKVFEAYSVRVDLLKVQELARASDHIWWQSLPECQSGHCEISQFIADALLWYCNHKVLNSLVDVRATGKDAPHLESDSTSPHGDFCDFSWTNGGAVKGQIPKGSVNFGTISETYPYDDDLIIFKFRAHTLREMLTHSTSGCLLGQFGHGSRLRFALHRGKNDDCMDTLDLQQRDQTGSDGTTVVTEKFTTTKGSAKLIYAEIKNQEGNWVAIDPTREYRMILNSWTASGGDGYSFNLWEHTKQTNHLATDIRVRDVLIKYLQAFTKGAFEKITTKNVIRDGNHLTVDPYVSVDEYKTPNVHRHVKSRDACTAALDTKEAYMKLFDTGCMIVATPRTTVDFLTGTCEKGERFDKTQGCVSCGKGYRSSYDFQSCISCEKGFYQPRDSGWDKCESCPLGHIPNKPKAADACVPCGRGEYSDEYVGAFECKKCPSGTAHNLQDVGLAKCPNCPRRYYQDEPGQLECKVCPAGFTTMVEASSRKEACLCMSGSYRESSNGVPIDVCKPCPKGLECTEDLKTHEWNGLLSARIIPGYMGWWKNDIRNTTFPPLEWLDLYRCIGEKSCPGSRRIPLTKQEVYVAKSAYSGANYSPLGEIRAGETYWLKERQGVTRETTSGRNTDSPTSSGTTTQQPMRNTAAVGSRLLEDEEKRFLSEPSRLLSISVAPTVDTLGNPTCPPYSYGIACAECAPDWFWDGNRCESCTGSSGLIDSRTGAFFFLFSGVCFCFIIWMIHCPSSEEGFTKDSFHMRIILMKCSSTWGLLIGHLQQLWLLNEIARIEDIHIFTSSISYVLHFNGAWNFKCLRIIDSTNEAVTLRTLFTNLMPGIAVLLLLFTIYTVQKVDDLVYKYTEGRKYLAATWRPNFFFTPSVILMTFETFFVAILSNAMGVAFSRYKHPEPNDDKESQLFQPSILRGSEDANNLERISWVAILLWCVGYICFLTWLFIAVGQRGLAASLWLGRSVMPMFARFKDGYYWWSLLILLRRVVLVMAMVAFDEARRRLWLASAVITISLFLNLYYRPYRFSILLWADSAPLFFQVLIGTSLISITSGGVEDGIAVSGSGVSRDAEIVLIVVIIIIMVLLSGVMAFQVTREIYTTKEHQKLCPDEYKIRVQKPTREEYHAIIGAALSQIWLGRIHVNQVKEAESKKEAERAAKRWNGTRLHFNFGINSWSRGSSFNGVFQSNVKKCASMKSRVSGRTDGTVEEDPDQREKSERKKGTQNTPAELALVPKSATSVRPGGFAGPDLADSVTDEANKTRTQSLIGGQAGSTPIGEFQTTFDPVPSSRQHGKKSKTSKSSKHSESEKDSGGGAQSNQKNGLERFGIENYANQAKKKSMEKATDNKAADKEDGGIPSIEGSGDGDKDEDDGVKEVRHEDTVVRRFSKASLVRVSAANATSQFMELLNVLLDYEEGGENESGELLKAMQYLFLAHFDDYTTNLPPLLRYVRNDIELASDDAIEHLLDFSRTIPQALLKAADEDADEEDDNFEEVKEGPKISEFLTHTSMEMSATTRGSSPNIRDSASIGASRNVRRSAEVVPSDDIAEEGMQSPSAPSGTGSPSNPASPATGSATKKAGGIELGLQKSAQRAFTQKGPEASRSLKAKRRKLLGGGANESAIVAVGSTVSGVSPAQSGTMRKTRKSLCEDGIIRMKEDVANGLLRKSWSQ